MATKILQTIARELQVTAYLDYRDFLEDLYCRAKERCTPYSYEAFAENLGFSATNVIRLVIVRQRQLSDKSAQTIVRALDLRRTARKYFLAMVRYGNARSTRLKGEHFQKMLAAKQESLISHREKDQLAFLSEWYHGVVLEMLRLDGGGVDPEWIATRLHPHVPSEKIRRSLALLESIGLIKADVPAGKMHVLQESPLLIAEDQAAGRLAMTRHHQATLDLAREALDRLPDGQREFDALTVTVSRAAFEEIKERIRQFCADVLAIESREQVRECVAQVNVNLFTLSKWEKE